MVGPHAHRHESAHRDLRRWQADASCSTCRAELWNRGAGLWAGRSPGSADHFLGGSQGALIGGVKPGHDLECELAAASGRCGGESSALVGEEHVEGSVALFAAHSRFQTALFDAIDEAGE